MRSRWLWLWALCVVGCSESTEDSGLPRFDAAVDAAGGSRDAGQDGGAVTDVGPPGDASVPGERPVLNELRSGSTTLPEYVELYNPTSKELSLAGWGVGGQKSDGSDDAPFAFPPDAKIASGGYVVVTTNKKDDGACKTLGVTPCHFTAGGISGSRGETLRLIDPSGAVVEKASIPPIDAETGPTLREPQSWGRLPNGTGSFGANTPTPGKANAAP